MKKKRYFMLILLTLFLMAGCAEKIERSGVVIDRNTAEPLAGVSIEIYLMHQRRDSLKEKVFTNSKGQFQIQEKINKNKLFQLRKVGYIGHVNSLSKTNDTITLERIEY